jgi:hypothetical protein
VSCSWPISQRLAFALLRLGLSVDHTCSATSLFCYPHTYCRILGRAANDTTCSFLICLWTEMGQVQMNTASNSTKIIGVVTLPKRTYMNGDFYCHIGHAVFVHIVLSKKCRIRNTGESMILRWASLHPQGQLLARLTLGLRYQYALTGNRSCAASNLEYLHPSPAVCLLPRLALRAPCCVQPAIVAARNINVVNPYLSFLANTAFTAKASTHSRKSPKLDVPIRLMPNCFRFK